MSVLNIEIKEESELRIDSILGQNENAEILETPAAVVEAELDCKIEIEPQIKCSTEIPAENSGNLSRLRRKKAVNYNDDYDDKKDHKHKPHGKIVVKKESELENDVKKKKPYKGQCLLCKKSFVKWANLAIHMRVHSGERPYKCDICDKSFVQTGHLNEHKKTHLPKGKISSFDCSHCKQKFRHKSALTRHEKGHTAPTFVCTFCPKTFSQSSHLKVHLRIHTGEKPFKCSEKGCKKAFIQNSYLIKHIKWHEDKKNKSKKLKSKSKAKKNCKKVKPSTILGI